MKPSCNILVPSNSLQGSQTLFAPEQCAGTTDVAFTFGINGSLRKREVQAQASYTEYYLFNSAANLKAYSNNGLDFAYYGYNASNTRTYKLSMLNQNQWVNGQPEPLHLQLQSAMFYPNAYINFNQNGEYTKHYYNGTERIASRLGDAQPESFVISSNDRLGFRIMQADEQARADLLELVEAGDVPIETPSVEITSLHPTNATSNIFYYHTNHLGSTAYVTDNNAIITQGFLYAPFGEITTEFNATFGNDIIPKYSFNAKELDEETGMYYYEARYYKPPVFTSRDPMFEKYFWMTPYAYCANNPVKYVDPDGEEPIDPRNGKKMWINFTKAAVYNYDETITNKVKDNDLIKHNQYSRFKEMNRDRDALTDVPCRLKHNLEQLSDASIQTLKNLFPQIEDKFLTSTHSQKSFYVWQKVGDLGTYSYVDDIYSRGRKSFNIISVKENIINQIISFERNNINDKYSIKSITTFETERIGNKLQVTETTQKYSNGKPKGNAIVKTYETTLEN